MLILFCDNLTFEITSKPAFSSSTLVSCSKIFPALCASFVPRIRMVVGNFVSMKDNLSRSLLLSLQLCACSISYLLDFKNL